MAAHTPIHVLLRRLRDAVNVPEVQDRLMQDKRCWNQLASSMDVIGDTDSAVAAYLSSPPIQDIGQLYLLAYGLLQVLFVQQDAVRHASEADGLNYEFPQELMAVRKIRNNAIGHPTKRGGKNVESFGIVQASLSHQGFTLYSFDWDHLDTFKPIQFQDLIAAQSNAVAQAIGQLIQRLQQGR